MTEVLPGASRPSASRFAETLLEILDRVEYRQADLADVSDPVYRLRYEAYRREQFIPFNDQQIAGDEFDHTPNARCYGVYIDGRLASSIRFHVVSPDCRFSPSRLIYGDMLDPLLDAGMTYIDPSRFTADHEASLAFPALPFLTLRIAAMASEYFHADYCLSSVRPEHFAFYKRIFGSEQLASERYYPGLEFPVVLAAAKVATIRDRVARRYPFFMSTREEREHLFSGDPGARVSVRATARAAQSRAEEAARD